MRDYKPFRSEDICLLVSELSFILRNLQIKKKIKKIKKLLKMKFHYYYYYLIVTIYKNEGSEDLNSKNTMVRKLDTRLVTNFTITSKTWF